MAVDRPITFRGLFTEDPDRKFGAESYFTANVCHENGARFQADCRDIYGFSYLQGNRNDRALIFTKIYTNRSDVFLCLLAPFKPGVEFWEWAGVWIRAKELNIDWLDGPFIQDPGKAEAEMSAIADVVNRFPAIGGSARLRIEK